MSSRNDGTTSSWMMTAPVPRYGPLATDVETDVCVVGAGIAGLSTAYHLVRDRISVVVVDDGEIGGGETGRTTAHLASALDDRFTELERMHGEEGARLAGQSHAAAIERIEATVAAERIDCDFRRVDGYLFPGRGQSFERLEEELAAARRAGLAVERAERAPFPSFDTGPCLRFAGQGQFHILKYLAGLAGAVERGGGRIFTGSHVEAIEGGDRARVVSTTGAEVRARAIVVATNTPVNDLVAIHTKQAPYRTYVIALRVARGAIPTALYWDDEDPYHYVRLQPLDDRDELLIVGGEDHKTGQADAGAGQFARLEAWTRERFPEAGEVLHAWSGQVMEPVDGLAYIGRNPGDAENVFVATGDSGQGMTHGTIAGMLLSDLIAGRANPWADLYSPSRVTLSAAKEYAKENVNVAAQYTDLVSPGDVDGVEQIPPGSGAVLRQGTSKIAVFRDEGGGLHAVTAVCAHLGCVVRWNGLERSWDCPCHGSRYDVDGRVLNGPAIKGLEPASIE